MNRIFKLLVWIGIFIFLSNCAHSETIRSATFKKKNEHCSLLAHVPSFSSPTDIQKKINERLHKEFTSTKLFDEECKLAIEDNELDSLNTEIKHTMSFYNQKILSLTYDMVSYRKGFPYPNTKIIPFNISIKDGTDIAFSSMFNSGYQKTLYKLIIADLKAKSIIQKDSEFTNKRDEYEFYLSKNGIHIVNLYDIHALAGVEVVISFQSIDGQLKNTFKELLK